MRTMQIACEEVVLRSIAAGKKWISGLELIIQQQVDRTCCFTERYEPLRLLATPVDLACRWQECEVSRFVFYPQNNHSFSLTQMI